MSEQSIYDKSVVIRNETQEYANTRGRVADVLDDINFTKANKEDVDAAIQLVLEELDITEAELYAYIDARNSEQDIEISKKLNKPFYNGFVEQYIVVSSAPGNPNNLQPITLSANQIPYWSGNTFFNSNIYTTGGGNIGIGTSSPTERLEVNGNAKVNALYLPINNTSATAYRLRSDGAYLYYANGSAVEKRLAFIDNTNRVFTYTPSGNFTISAIKTALEAQGMIFNDCHIIIILGANNYTCSIDLAVSNIVFTIERTGTGSISFTSSRTLNAGTDNITILNGNESSIALIQTKATTDFLTIRNK